MAYKYLAKAWAKPESSYVKALMQQRLIEWRDQPVIVRVEKPTRLDRARRLGYRAKQGFVIARVRVRRGGLRKQRPRSGRRPKRMGVKRYKPAKSIQLIAEERVARRFPNLQVLNSYWVAQDGRHKWFEVILVDPNHPAIRGDEKINWVCNSAQTSRVFRGLTSAGREARGLHRRGRGAEKFRPSKKAVIKRGKRKD